MPIARVPSKISCQHTYMSRYNSLRGIWKGMVQRCTNPKNKQYHRYGGRGIKVCAEWTNSFSTFAKHVGERPEGKSLGRIRNNGNYEPGNVRWETIYEQANNRSSNLLLFHEDQLLTLAQWVVKLDLPDKRTRKRIGQGWTIGECINGRESTRSPRSSKPKTKYKSYDNSALCIYNKVRAGLKL